MTVRQLKSEIYKKLVRQRTLSGPDAMATECSFVGL